MRSGSCIVSLMLAAAKTVYNGNYDPYIIITLELAKPMWLRLLNVTDRQTVWQTDGRTDVGRHISLASWQPHVQSQIRSDQHYNYMHRARRAVGLTTVNELNTSDRTWRHGALCSTSWSFHPNRANTTQHNVETGRRPLASMPL